MIYWLEEQQTALGFKLTARARKRRAELDVVAYSETLPTGMSIVPFERLRIDRQDLDGSQGANRGQVDFHVVDAENDRQAIQAWITATAGSPHTVKAYRKEGERLLLWAVVEQQKPLSSLNLDDCTRYLVVPAKTPQGRRRKGFAVEIAGVKLTGRSQF